MNPFPYGTGKIRVHSVSDQTSDVIRRHRPNQHALARALMHRPGRSQWIFLFPSGSHGCEHPDGLVLQSPHDEAKDGRRSAPARRPLAAGVADVAPIDVLLERLAAAGVGLHERGVDGDGSRRWRGNCPLCGKDDRLQLWERDLKGDLGLSCFAHCEKDALLELLGLTWRDLRAERGDDVQSEGGSTPASAITPRRIRWVWKGRLRKGYPSLSSRGVEPGASPRCSAGSLQS